MLPNDPIMLVSFLNTRLRDDDMTLEQVIETNDGDVDSILDKLDQAGYQYDQSVNQLKQK